MTNITIIPSGINKIVMPDLIGHLITDTINEWTE